MKCAVTPAAMGLAERVRMNRDSHILEPPDLSERYLEPWYRDRALRIRVGDDGFERLLIDGRPSTIARPGQLATLGGMGKVAKSLPDGS